MEMHVNTGSEDSDRFDVLGALIRQAGPRLQSSSEVETQVRHAAYESWQRGLRRERQRRVVNALAVAASLILALTIGWRVMTSYSTANAIGTLAFQTGESRLNGNITDARNSELHESDRLTTGDRGGVRVELVNAASIRLAANTELRWQSSNAIELIAGSIYIDSGARHAPLTVTTKFGVVSHQGTRYQIRATPDGLNVGVRDGEVEVTGALGKTQAHSGEEVGFASDGRITRTKVVSYGNDWSWADALAPRFAIENRSVEEFLLWIANETGRTLKFADASLERAAQMTTLHGQSGSLTPDQALEIIMPTTDFSASFTNEYLFVSRR
jgi:ferric-dicitrate binding protein FerR (iron transport regulator)